jgi:hypothetical protein
MNMEGMVWMSFSARVRFLSLPRHSKCQQGYTVSYPVTISHLLVRRPEIGALNLYASSAPSGRFVQAQGYSSEILLMKLSPWQFAPRRPGFSLRLRHKEYMVNKMTLRRGFFKHSAIFYSTE